MTVSMTCKHCNLAINADDEDELVHKIQAHVLGHNQPHELTRDHIMSRLRRQPPDGIGSENSEAH